MSLVTAFMVGLTGFVLLVPVAMVVVLVSATSALRRQAATVVTDAAVPAAVSVEAADLSFAA